MKNLQREPVLAAMIVRIVGYLVAILVVVGVVSAEQETALLDAAAVLAPGAALLLDAILGLLTRNMVTPVADPRNDAGVALVALVAQE